MYDNAFQHVHIFFSSIYVMLLRNNLRNGIKKNNKKCDMSSFREYNFNSSNSQGYVSVLIHSKLMLDDDA